MVLVSDIAKLAARIELAVTAMVLVSAMANDVNVYLVAATDIDTQSAVAAPARSHGYDTGRANGDAGLPDARPRRATHRQQIQATTTSS